MLAHFPVLMVAGCLVAEPIKEAFKVIPRADKEKPAERIMKGAIKRPATLQAIWVTSSNRRKHIATHLLNAARRSFCEGHELDPSQLAFSEPTSAGRALASSYMGSRLLLVYRAQ
ncbi:hypothetical protein SAY86_024508 [Trapa natans]|uniref:N-acetyltransferase ESCO acetyl-transferase domain-containing protein n=1 Tax=Trapa natans TaxID=22666 RepID=A0AAN7RJR9_TRANT|nr:hypothetical protein SAY86_024508 [Trapa natans]